MAWIVSLGNFIVIRNAITVRIGCLQIGAVVVLSRIEQTIPIGIGVLIESSGNTEGEIAGSTIIINSQIIDSINSDCMR